MQNLILFQIALIGRQLSFWFFCEYRLIDRFQNHLAANKIRQLPGARIGRCSAAACRAPRSKRIAPVREPAWSPSNRFSGSRYSKFLRTRLTEAR